MIDLKNFKIVIEIRGGSYKSFGLENDPVWYSYPLQGVTYPVDYGYIRGYRGEDEGALDVFVGNGDKNGYIKVWRLDVAEETKFFLHVSDKELESILEAFKPVLVKHEVLDDSKFNEEISRFSKT